MYHSRHEEEFVRLRRLFEQGVARYILIERGWREQQLSAQLLRVAPPTPHFASGQSDDTRVLEFFLGEELDYKSLSMDRLPFAASLRAQDGVAIIDDDVRYHTANHQAVAAFQLSLLRSLVAWARMLRDDHSVTSIRRIIAAKRSYLKSLRAAQARAVRSVIRQGRRRQRSENT